MEIAVSALVLIGIVCFASVRKMLRRNKDPRQQKLALMFIAAGRSNQREVAKIASEIGTFIADEGWDRVAAAPRIAHALSMVSVVEPAIYENAVEVSRRDELWNKISGAMREARTA